MTNYYHVLGLSENATPMEIKGAFKKLAVQYHPDKHRGDAAMEEKFKEINVAYQVLSNEYEKARFDLKLKYQQFNAENEQRSYTYQPPKSDAWKRRARARYQRPQVDYKQNLKATAYAFGFTFVIALLVMSGVWMKQGYDDNRQEKLLAERRHNYNLAKEYFDRGEYKEAFQIMAELNVFRSSESDMRVFKTTMLDQMISRGDLAFKRNDYEKAISLYELVQEFAPSLPFHEVSQKLAELYRKTGNPQKALEIWENLLLEDYEIIKSLVKISEIHRDELNDLNEALDNLLIAHRLAIKRYKAFYGEGYPLVINEKYLPKSHYYLYTNLADLYLRLDDPEMAIKAADWNKYVWPDSAISYVTSAEAFQKLGNNYQVCVEYSGAKDRGWIGVSPEFCR